jgi:hypothetical protein
MYEYGVGGNDVPQDASEGLADLQQNRTLFVQKLTDDDPVKPVPVYDLKTVEEVFDHFKPKVSVEFEKEDGSLQEDEIRFGNLGDFGTKNIVAQSPFLTDLNIQQEQYQKIVKQVKTNKLMKVVTENSEAKAAFIASLQALIQELEENP